MGYDIFFSYPHKDAEEVKQILQALQAEGLNVWIDKSEISDYASITNSIVEGLAHSRVLLAYYSLNYWRSRACQWELTAGFLAAQREGDPRKRVLVINPDEKAEHIHPVELRDELFQKAPKDAEALKKLVQSVKNHVSGINSAIGEINSLTQPSWFPNTGAGSNRFVGRLPDMWRIHSALHSSGVPVITGAVASAVVQLQGMGGVGKSLLAEEYALRYAAAFPGGVFWLRAFGNDDAKTSMGEEREAERIRQISYFALQCGITGEKKSPEETEAALKRELELRGKPYLWIVDDVPSGMVIENLKKWFSPHPLGRTLVTTRTKEYNSLGTLIPIGVLEPREAYDLLTLRRKPIGNLFIWDDVPGNDNGRLFDYLKQNHGIDLSKTAKIEKDDKKKTIIVSDEKNQISLNLNNEKTRVSLKIDKGKTCELIAQKVFDKLSIYTPAGWDEENVLLKLIDDLGYHALAVDVAGALLEKTKGLQSFADFRKKLSHTEKDELEYASKLKEILPTGHEKSIAITLLRSIKQLEPEGLDFLRLASVLAVAPIPASLVSAVFSKVDDLDKDSGDMNAMLAFDQVENLSLAESDKESGAKTVHTLISRTVRFRETAPERIDQIEAAAVSALIDKLSVINDGRIHSELKLEVSHARQLVNRGDDIPIANLIGLVARYDFLQGAFRYAETLHRRELEIQQRILGTEHADCLSTMTFLANTLQSQGNANEARHLCEQVVKITQKNLSDEHSNHQFSETFNALQAMALLASTLFAQGDLLGARELLEDLLELTRKTMGNDELFTLSIMNNLAEVLKAQGDLSSACKIQEQVLEIARRTLGDEHPYTLTAMNNLGSTLRRQGNFSEARKIQEQVLELALKIWDEEHPNTLTTMNNLAETLRSQGDLDGARKNQEKVLEISRRKLGEDHPNTLHTINNLANTLWHLNDFAGAQRLHEQALELRRKKLGPEHPDTLSSMNNLAETFRVQGDFAGAQKMQEQVLELRKKILGVEHPDTLNTMNCLAGTLRDLGDFAGAQKMQEQVLEIRKRILGAEHPDTLTTMNNLANTLNSQGDLPGARKIHEQVLEISRKVLGNEHPNTLTTMNNFAEILMAQGDLPGARKIQEQVLEIVRKIMGNEHPYTLSIMNNLTETLYAQGDIQSARRIQVEVFEIKRKILGDNHPETRDTLNTMDNLANDLWTQGDLINAREFQELILQIKRKILGDEHPNTLNTANNLAATLQAQGDFSNATKLLEQVLEIRRKIQGEEHPDTLTAMNNYGVTLRVQGDLPGARKMQEQVLEIMRKILGNEHPTTLITMKNIAVTLEVQRDFAGAQKIYEQALKISQKIQGVEHPDTLTTMKKLADMLYAQGNFSSAGIIHKNLVELWGKTQGIENPNTLAAMNNLASTFQAQGDFSSARKLLEKLLEIMQSIKGNEHRDTTITAWNLVFVHREMGDAAAAIDILEKYLGWLLDRDPATLEANQQRIREMMIQIIGQKDQSE